MSISIFPALSEWLAEDLKYQLIPLSNVLYFNIKPLVAQYVAEQDLVTDTNLRHHSIQLIIFLQAIDLEACLKLANSLLKLGIVNWQILVFFVFLEVAKCYCKLLGLLD